MKPETAARLRAEGFTYEDALEVPPGKYHFKWIVRDDLTGKVGSVSANVEVL